MEVPQHIRDSVQEAIWNEHGNGGRLVQHSGLSKHTLYRIIQGRASKCTLTKIEKALETFGDACKQAQVYDHVYFVATTDREMVKIGFTRGDPHERLVCVQNECGQRLELLGTIRGGSLEMERDIHGAFSGKRIKGEWFRLDEELGMFIEQNTTRP